MFNKEDTGEEVETTPVETEDTTYGKPLQGAEPESEAGAHEAAEAASEPARATENNSEGGTAQVKFVGRTRVYRDGETGIKFPRNEPVAVSEEDADRLVALGGDREVFVRTDN